MKKPKPEPPEGRPTDYLLRKAGFKIHARPAGSEALWERDGTVYPEAAAWHWMNLQAAKEHGQPGKRP